MEWNKYIGFLFVVLSLGVAGGCSEEQVAPEKGVTDGIGKTEDIYPGMLKVKLSRELADRLNLSICMEGQKTVGSPEIDSIIAGLGTVHISRLFPPAGSFEVRQQAAGLDCWFRIDYDNGSDPLQLRTRCAAIRGVEAACPQYRYTDVPYELTEAVSCDGNTRLMAAKPFNDPGLGVQWHYDVSGSELAPEVGLGLFSAWKVTAGSRDVIVAVIDKGVDATHEDLKDNMWVNTAELNGKYNTDDDGNGYKDDIYGYNFYRGIGDLVPADHGTHVAGTVAAVNNNGKGVCGVAGGSGQNDGVRIMSCQISDESVLSGLRGMEAAFAYAAHNGAVIAQCSWNIASFDFDQSLYEAIRYFVEHAGCDENGNQTGPMKGGIVFVGAGNEGATTKRYPGAYDNTVAVAALDEKNSRPVYSNYGSWIDLAAPGGAPAGGQQKYRIYSTLPGNRYGYMSGASMACPHVSGVAALVVSQMKGPGFTNEELKRILFQSVNPLEAEQMGRGALRADKALLRDDHQAPLRVTDLQVVQDEKLRFCLTWSVTPDPNDRIAKRYTVYYGTTAGSGEAWEHQAIVEVTKGVGEKLSWEIVDKGTLYFAVAGEDIWGNRSELSAVACREWKDDGLAPARVQDAEIRVVEGKAFLAWKQVEDEGDGGAALYRITAYRNGTEDRQYVLAVGGKLPGEELVLSLEIPEDQLPEYEFTLRAVDRWGNESSVSEKVGMYVIGARELKVVALNGRLGLQWGKDFTGTKRIILYDLSGRKLLSRTLSVAKAPGGEEVELKQMAAGLYVLCFEAAGLNVRKQIVLR